MKIQALFIKPKPGEPMRRVDSFETLAAEGIVGDCHRDRASPRQLLIVESRVLEELGLGAGDIGANIAVSGTLDEGALAKSGAVLTLGGAVDVRLTLPCESCAKLNRVRPGLARKLEGRRGVLARVLTSGVVKVGDEVQRGERILPPLSSSWPARVAEIVDALPDGMSLTYRQLARMAGLQSSYCRAFPKVLARLPAEKATRVVAGSGVGLSLWSGEDFYTRVKPNEMTMEA